MTWGSSSARRYGIAVLKGAFEFFIYLTVVAVVVLAFVASFDWYTSLWSASP